MVIDHLMFRRNMIIARTHNVCMGESISMSCTNTLCKALQLKVHLSSNHHLLWGIESCWLVLMMAKLLFWTIGWAVTSVLVNGFKFDTLSHTNTYYALLVITGIELLGCIWREAQDHSSPTPIFTYQCIIIVYTITMLINNCYNHHQH